MEREEPCPCDEEVRLIAIRREGDARERYGEGDALLTFVFDDAVDADKRDPEVEDAPESRREPAGRPGERHEEERERGRVLEVVGRPANVEILAAEDRARRRGEDLEILRLTERPRESACEDSREEIGKAKVETHPCSIWVPRIGSTNDTA